MPLLLDQRREAFAQGLANGKTQAQAYTDAGYAGKAADRNASAMLIKQPEIRQRADEILQGRLRMEEESSRQALKELKIEKSYVLEKAVKVLEIALGERMVRTSRGETHGVYEVVKKEGAKRGKSTKTGIGVMVAHYERFLPDLPVAAKMVELLGREHQLFIETKVITDKSPLDEIPPTRLEDAKKAIADAIARQERANAAALQGGSAGVA